MMLHSRDYIYTYFTQEIWVPSYEPERTIILKSTLMQISQATMTPMIPGRETQLDPGMDISSCTKGAHLAGNPNYKQRYAYPPPNPNILDYLMPSAR